MKITRRQIRKIIKEYYDALPEDHVDGMPWSGTLEDLAYVQGRTWAGGDVVDADGYSNLVKIAMQFSNGTIKKMF